MIPSVSHFCLNQVLAFRYCHCLCLSVHVLIDVCVPVCTITHYPFKQVLPSLDQRCKMPWLRCLSLWGWLTLTVKLKCKLKYKSYPTWACPSHNLPPIKVRISKLGPKMHLSTVQIVGFYWLIFYINRQQYWKCHWTINICANAHGKT